MSTMFQKSSGKRGFFPWKTSGWRRFDEEKFAFLSEAAQMRIRHPCMGVNYGKTVERPSSADENSWIIAVLMNLFVDVSEISALHLTSCVESNKKCERFLIAPETTLPLERDIPIVLPYLPSNATPQYKDEMDLDVPPTGDKKDLEKHREILSAPQYIRSAMTWAENKLHQDCFRDSENPLPYMEMGERESLYNELKSILLSTTAMPSVCIEMIGEYAVQTPSSIRREFRIIQRVFAIFLRVLAHLKFAHSKPDQYEPIEHFYSTLQHLTALGRSFKLFHEHDTMTDADLMEITLKSLETPHPSKPTYSRPFHAFIPRISTAMMKKILTRCNDLRLSEEIQKKLSEKDDSQWFEKVYIQMHEDVLQDPSYGPPVLTQLSKKHPEYPHLLKEVSNELFSARANFASHPEMQEFMKTLLHVKYDFAQEGDLWEGMDAPDVPLFAPIPSTKSTSEPIEYKKLNLSTFMILAEQLKVPLVLVCGSCS